MSPSAALESEIVFHYVAIIGGLLLFAGALLTALKITGRNVTSMLATYKGWLVMAPIALGVIFLGRTATIVGVTLLAIYGFKEFARATGLYDDWWLTGTVYAGIAALCGTALMTDPRLGTPGWYGLFGKSACRWFDSAPGHLT